jgi:hypothetical protein
MAGLPFPALFPALLDISFIFINIVERRETDIFISVFSII